MTAFVTHHMTTTLKYVLYYTTAAIQHI